MNKSRRRILAGSIEIIDKGKEIFEETLSYLQTCAAEEREYYDNMPESIQQSERGEVAGAAADNLEAAVNYLDEIIQNMGTIIDNINSSTGE